MEEAIIKEIKRVMEEAIMDYKKKETRMDADQGGNAGLGWFANALNTRDRSSNLFIIDRSKCLETIINAR